LDGGNFDVVSARDHSRALRITRDGVKGLASRIDDRRVENVGGTAGEAELESWTLGVMRVGVDYEGRAHQQKKTRLSGVHNLT
jgi:hypothetical protein